MQTIVAIAAGGAAGALLRHYMNGAIVKMAGGSSFPWGIFAINISGSFALGILTGLFSGFLDPPQAVEVFLTVGLLGAFTTFSTFSMDALALMERGKYLHAGSYIAGSVILAIGGLYAGILLVHAFTG